MVKTVPISCIFVTLSSASQRTHDKIQKTTWFQNVRNFLCIKLHISSNTFDNSGKKELHWLTL